MKKRERKLLDSGGGGRRRRRRRREEWEACESIDTRVGKRKRRGRTETSLSILFFTLCRFRFSSRHLFPFLSLLLILDM